MKPSIRHQFRGTALVIVLAMLVILLGLSVAFLSRVRVERLAASSSAAAASSRQLADVAVNLVQGQIRQATTLSGNVAWTSQPGMIRTFASGSAPSFSASSNLLRIYKLYSANNMIADSHQPGADSPPADWATAPGVWTDLNRPVLTPNPSGGTPAEISVYPILDPAARNAVEGFEIAGNAPTQNTDNPIPMPVRWLYQLRDGTLVAATGSGQQATIAGASDSNPIVGRVAFWTDDESCKVNINTSADGSFWSSPTAHTTQERNFGSFQPAQKEFQAYPGHPATTSLAPVLFATSATSTPALTKPQREAIFSVVPRIIGGGSQGGTVEPTGKLVPDSDRLYANVDELIFNAQRLSQPIEAGITPMKLEQSRFFLTATSRAPELTLLNTPRIAVWPTADRERNAAGHEMRTPYDKLLRFCAEVPEGILYGFQRFDSRSPTADWSNIPRNRQLLRYLRWLSDQVMPGFGQSLVSKYGLRNRDQLLVQMLDYIRCANLHDDTLTPNKVTGNPGPDQRPQFTNSKALNDTLGRGTAGYGQVAPLRVPADLGDTYPAQPDQSSHMGFGRFHTISEAGLLFICGADGSGFQTTPPNAPTLAQCGNSRAVVDANDAKLLSNTSDNRMTGGTLLAGEPFLDMGIGARAGDSTTGSPGAANGKFDWDDSAPTAYGALFAQNGMCDFEPWDDLNGNGQWDAGEPFYDANGNGSYDGEAHEPLHDYGRNNRNNKPSWTTTTPPRPSPAWPLAPTSPTAVASWPPAAAVADSGPNGRYDPAERIIQMAVLFEWFSPAQGYPVMAPEISIQVEQRGGTFRINDVEAEIPQTVSINSPIWADNPLRLSGWQASYYHPWGATAGYRPFLLGRFVPRRGQMPADAATSIQNEYGLVSAPIRIPIGNGTFDFKGPEALVVRIYSGNNPSADRLVQTLEIKFPPATFPQPELVSRRYFNDTQYTPRNDASNTIGTRPEYWWTFHSDGTQVSAFSWENPTLNPNARQGGRLAWSSSGVIGVRSTPMMNAGNIIRPEDTFKTVVPYHGDYRLVAGAHFVPEGVFQPSQHYFNRNRVPIPDHPIPPPSPGTGQPSPGTFFPQIASHFSGSAVANEHMWTAYHQYLPPVSGNDRLVANANYNPRHSITGPNLNANGDQLTARHFPDFPIGAQSFQRFGDFDNALAWGIDGPFINRPDDGTTHGLGIPGGVPYFYQDWQDVPLGETFFSPNRIMPGPGMFGSLPVRLWSGNTADHSSAASRSANTSAWTTLLFRPQNGHPGMQSPPDHLWLDFFWMPVVEPYAISEPFSTAGKINMNYAIEPFGYIRRATGLAALLRGERITRIAHANADTYKRRDVLLNDTLRVPLDTHRTLAQFDSKFAAGDVFLSASQICEIHLIPQGQDLATMQNGFWSTHALTGDNRREEPYTRIQGRLTTRSNTYTVHYRAQSLKKVQGTPANVWDESRDRVMGEYRGSTTIERYITPKDPRIPDYAASLSDNPSARPPELTQFYKWRVLSTRQFAP